MSAATKTRLTKPERAEVVQVIREAIARELPKALRALCAPAAPAPRRTRRTPAEARP